MPTNKKLVPTPITDRNGKQTTVHKKPAFADEPLKSPPQPTLQSQSELKRAAALELTKHDPVVSWGRRKHSRNYAFCVKKFSSYSAATLQRVIDVSGTSTGFDLYIFMTGDDPSEALVNDWCILNPILVELQLKKFEVLFLLNALPYYEHLVPQNDG